MLACDYNRQPYSSFNHHNHNLNHNHYNTDNNDYSSSQLLLHHHHYEHSLHPRSSTSYSARPIDNNNNSSPPSASLSSHDLHLMNSFNFTHPAVRLHAATPTPASSYSSSSAYHQPAQADASHPHFQSAQWNQPSNNPYLSAHNSFNPGVKRSHQRTPSNSSAASSQYHYSSPAMSTASKLSQSYSVDAPRKYSHNLPTPTQTPTQDSFLSSQYQSNYNSQHADATANASIAMNRAMDQPTEDDVPGMSRSGRHSVSSLGQEPTTPHTVVDGYDGDFKIPSHGEIPPSSSSASSDVEAWLHEYLQFDDDADPHGVPRFERTISDLKHTVPKFDRTMSDIYADELYDPSTLNTSVPAKQSTSSYLSPFVRNTQVTEALRAAQIARSHSPSSKVSRGISPFRPESPYVQDAGKMQTAAQIRAQQKAQADLTELSQHISPQSQQEMKTISPKDAMLEYRPDDDEQTSNDPLFPQQGYDAQDFSGAAQTQFANFNPATAPAWSSGNRQQFQPSPLVGTQAQTFNFSAPAAAALQFQSIPFDYRQAKQDPTPDFPAHLTSMESSASEAPASSQGSQYQALLAPSVTSNASLTKPEGNATLADSGAFTCTYHGCNMRFPTQQKLQKHKRDGHRASIASTASSASSHSLPNSQPPAITPGIGSGMSSAALLARNSQAGPHKCDRINPTTGKSCNTIFSRPYDLTRHEDTIHNVRKQKVRCALCVEEKMFSRNDALTRHMRVVHPEVDFPGKHRRRGGAE